MSKSFNIQETVNRNIEKNQFPSFANHRSLVGWCSMNYPKVLVNPIYIKKDPLPEDKKFQLETLFQMKNPTDRVQREFVKPFTDYVEPKQDDSDRDRDKQAQSAFGPKVSSLTLATTKHETRAKIFSANNKLSEQYSAVLPLSNILGSNKDGNYNRKVRQIGEVYYNPVNEGEEMRHLKKLPNTVLNEHNLLEIMDSNLEYLDLQYKTDISNDLINKIGYLAENIKELVLIAVPITNEILIELGISCKKLSAIDISLCKSVEEFAVTRFINSRNSLRKFSANHNDHSITDACLQALSKCKDLEVLNINFCREVTSMGLETLVNHSFLQLGLSSLPKIKGEDFSALLLKSSDKLQLLNLSLNSSKDINNQLMIRVGMCHRLKELVLTGCQNISDEGMNNLIYGDKAKGKGFEGFAYLHTLKLGGLRNVSDQVYQLCKRCPVLVFLEVNNLERLTDHFVDQIKSHPSLRTLMVNFTPNISDEKLKEIRDNVKTLKIIRNIVKMTDPNDDGLRMPIPPASLKIKKPKKKKK